MTLFLFGFPRSGKTILGKEMALSQGRPFIDLDYEIEKREGVSVRALFMREGEKTFRKKEQEALFALDLSKEPIVALGGGALLLEENVAFVRKRGKLFYVEVEIETLRKRLLTPPIPSFLEGRSFDDFYSERKGHYERIWRGE